MFKNLMDFGYKRTPKEAIGFYIAYFVLVILLAGLSGGIYGLISGANDFAMGVRIGNILAIIASLVMSFLLLQKKNLLGNYIYMLLALLSGILALLGGALLGLIPVAYISTK